MFKRYTALLLLFFILLTIPANSARAEFDPLLLSDDFTPEVAVSNVFALNTQFDKILFAQQAGTPTALPAANHLMLALLVAEKLNLEEEIYLSDNALSHADTAKTPALRFKKNTAYSIANLLLAHLFEHSEVAAVALAEKLSGNVNEAVFLMNQRARELELSETGFSNITGKVELKDQKHWSIYFDLTTDYQYLVQKSTLQDLAKLIRVIQKNPTLSGFFKEREVFTRLPDGTMITISHPFDRIFYRNDKGIDAAWNLKYDGMSFSFVSGKIDQNEYLILMSEYSQSNFSAEIIELIDDLAGYYLVDNLVTEGQSYPGTDTTVEGDTIHLIFLKSIKYIKPVNRDFLKPSVSYISGGPHKRPLARGVVVGKVIFTLADGSQVEAEVGSDKAILYENTYFSRIVQSIQQNPDLGYLIIALSVLLIAVLLFRIFVTVRALRKQKKLNDLIELQKKLQDRIEKR